MSKRKCKNNIYALCNERGQLAYDVSQIQQLAVYYYQNLYSGDTTHAQRPFDVSCRSLVNELGSNFLLQSITTEEVKISYIFYQR